MADARLRRLGVWTDVAANGGTRESVFVAPLQLTDDIETREDGHLGTEKLTAVVDASEPAYDDVTPGKVLRVELADGEATEWRVFKVTTDRNADGGLEATIVCESIAWDLIRRVPLVDRVEAGRADLDFSLLSLTPTEWIDDVLLTTSGFPSWITRGTVDPTDDLSLPVDGEPAGKLLNKIAELTASEWTLRRNGATDYKIDVVSERNGARPNLMGAPNALDDAVWSDSATVTADDTTAPDGTATMDKVEDDDAGATEQLKQTAPISDTNDTSRLTVWLKKRVGAPVAAMSLAHTGGTLAKLILFVDPEDGTSAVAEDSGGSDSSHSVREEVSGFWKVQLEKDNNGSGNETLEVILQPAARPAGDPGGGGFDDSVTGHNHFWGVDAAENETGASSRRPLIALRRNMLSMSKETTAENQATRVYPRGGGQRGFRGTMADAKWKVTGVA